MNSLFYKLVENKGLNNTIMFIATVALVFMVLLIAIPMIFDSFKKKIDNKIIKCLDLMLFPIIILLFSFFGFSAYKQYDILVNNMKAEYATSNQLVINQINESERVDFQDQHIVLKLNTKSEIQIDKKTKQLITSDADAQFLLFADKKLNEMNIKLKPESIKKVDQFTYSGIDAESNETITITNENTANVLIN